MNCIVSASEKSLEVLVPEIENKTAKLSRFLGIKDKTVEIFLVGPKTTISQDKKKKFEHEFNVLSFPARVDVPRPDLPAPSLGEIYLNPSYIKEKGESLDLMLVHGLLHLLGYDHEKESDRKFMESKEKELLNFLALP